MTFKQAIVARNDLGMGKGKLAAQCSHASVQAAMEAREKNPGALQAWLDEGMEKIVLKTAGEESLNELYSRARRAKLPCSLVHDAGRTQVPSGSATAIAIGPAEEKAVDAITGKLKLL